MRPIRYLVPVSALAFLLAMTWAPAVYATGVPSVAQQFSRCVLALQHGNYHHATVAEATQCAPANSRQIRASNIAAAAVALTPGETAILVRKDGSAALVGLSPSSDVVLTAFLASCYNTWANPQPWGTSAIDYVSINVHGYGNHCGYSNVPTTPTVTATCFVPWCNATNQAGHYDSNQGAAWFNDRRAAGWANISFNIGDVWACRGYIDTNGNGSGFCS